jgi:hypothetical protein
MELARGVTVIPAVGLASGKLRIGSIRDQESDRGDRGGTTSWSEYRQGDQVIYRQAAACLYEGSCDCLKDSLCDS